MNLVGPSLADIAATGGARIKEPDYHGKATDAAGYIRESILDPNAFVVAGPTFSSGGHSLMPTGLRRVAHRGADRRSSSPIS